MILDPSGRGPTARQLTLSGLAVLATMVLLLSLLALRYTGYFEAKVPVTVTLTSTGDGLPARADVKFRGMVVGAVSAVDVVAAGQRQEVFVDLKPAVAETIPDNVTARVIPNNLFGVTAIELVDNGPSEGVLHAGSTIAEDTSVGTVQLQTTLTVLRDVLDNIQPEKLGRVLATFSAALDPGARVPGSTIERLDNWITQVRAIDGVGELLGDLGRATTALSQSAPELVGVLAESVTTARTLTERRDELIALLANASGAVDSVNSLFAGNPNAAKELVPGLDELFGSLARDPDAIPYTAANLNATLEKMQSVFSFGPRKQMVWKMDVSFTPFQQYTAEDCPRYGEMTGPRCGGPSVPTVAPPQEYPPQMLPRRLDSAGSAPAVIPVPGVAPAPAHPGAPAVPGLPFIPGLPAIPGITAPLPGPPGPGGAAPGIGGAAPAAGLPGPASSVPGPASSAPGAAGSAPGPAGSAPAAGVPGSAGSTPGPADSAPNGGTTPGTAPNGVAPAATGRSASASATQAAASGPAGPQRMVPLPASGARPVTTVRGHAAVAEIVGGKPTATQLLLLTPLLAGGSVEVYA
ncbi:MCE family protein [Nocardia cyriacigeorgica]|uniref:Virulence factor Mce family protein n=1 Tax=Nocardia cyriacigeorgica TaxID=135487 RepID=A0A4V6ICI9_9NOCA|nr:MCE family protein [Nocardia cyriacigeorgica]VFA99833.1 virulence factor Mce family protein [Nocardia cyriacigeorgica]